MRRPTPKPSSDGLAVVTVLARGSEAAVHLSPEEEAAILEAIAEADRGETVSPEELFARLRRIESQ